MDLISSRAARRKAELVVVFGHRMHLPKLEVSELCTASGLAPSRVLQGAISEITLGVRDWANTCKAIGGNAFDLATS